jgi:hypothetical protein
MQYLKNISRGVKNKVTTHDIIQEKKLKEIKDFLKSQPGDSNTAKSRGDKPKRSECINTDGVMDRGMGQVIVRKPSQEGPVLQESMMAQTPTSLQVPGQSPVARNSSPNLKVPGVTTFCINLSNALGSKTNLDDRSH